MSASATAPVGTARPAVRTIAESTATYQAAISKIDRKFISKAHFEMSDAEIEDLRKEAFKRGDGVIHAMDVYSKMAPSRPEFRPSEFEAAWNAICEAAGIQETLTIKQKTVSVRFKWPAIACAVQNKHVADFSGVEAAIRNEIDINVQRFRAIREFSGAKPTIQMAFADTLMLSLFCEYDTAVAKDVEEAPSRGKASAECMLVLREKSDNPNLAHVLCYLAKMLEKSFEPEAEVTDSSGVKLNPGKRLGECLPNNYDFFARMQKSSSSSKFFMTRIGRVLLARHGDMYASQSCTPVFVATLAESLLAHLTGTSTNQVDALHLYKTVSRFLRWTKVESLATPLPKEPAGVKWGWSSITEELLHTFPLHFITQHAQVLARGGLAESGRVKSATLLATALNGEKAYTVRDIERTTRLIKPDMDMGKKGYNDNSTNLITAYILTNFECIGELLSNMAIKDCSFKLLLSNRVIACLGRDGSGTNTTEKVAVLKGLFGSKMGASGWEASARAACQDAESERELDKSSGLKWLYTKLRRNPGVLPAAARVLIDAWLAFSAEAGWGGGFVGILTETVGYYKYGYNRGYDGPAAETATHVRPKIAAVYGGLNALTVPTYVGHFVAEYILMRFLDRFWDRWWPLTCEGEGNTAWLTNPYIQMATRTFLRIGTTAMTRALSLALCSVGWACALYGASYIPQSLITISVGGFSAGEVLTITYDSCVSLLFRGLIPSDHTGLAMTINFVASFVEILLPQLKPTWWAVKGLINVVFSLPRLLDAAWDLLTQSILPFIVTNIALTVVGGATIGIVVVMLWKYIRNKKRAAEMAAEESRIESLIAAEVVGDFTSWVAAKNKGKNSLQLLEQIAAEAKKIHDQVAAAGKDARKIEEVVTMWNNILAQGKADAGLAAVSTVAMGSRISRQAK